MARLDAQRIPSKKHARPNVRQYARGYDTVPHDTWGEASFVPPPPAATVGTVSPATGTTAGGTNVTITGTNFIGATGVTFGGTAATNFVVVSDTSITCTTPAKSAGAVTVVVLDPDGNGSKASGYTYV